jgi:Na+/proline symporter
MNTTFLLALILLYFIVLLVVAFFTSKNASNDSFFIGNKNSHWGLVAFGMIGTSLSGMTFISVPGTVSTSGFNYFQVVLGYFIGYVIVAYVLLPLYYKLNVTSIYSYLATRLGIVPYKTGAAFFMLSRTLGATLRLYLVIKILQVFILDNLGISFELTTIIIIAMILAYTFKGGVKTIVWTDTLQTSFMLLSLVISVFYLKSNLHISFAELWSSLKQNKIDTIFYTDYQDTKFFLKQIVGGIFVTITMTGLDQEMMQKNISVKTLKDAQKNMLSFSVILVFVNFLFLILGALLFLYAQQNNLQVKPDELFPTIALSNAFPSFVGILFIIGLISALFPSADGAITALTSSFCLDILNLKNNPAIRPEKQEQTRRIVHLTFAGIFLLLVFFFRTIDNGSLIDMLLKIASYTYGPLLGIFGFGILTKRSVKPWLVPVVSILAPFFCYLLQSQWAPYFGDYKFGLELLIINGSLVFFTMLLFSNKQISIPDGRA